MPATVPVHELVQTVPELEEEQAATITGSVLLAFKFAADKKETYSYVYKRIGSDKFSVIKDVPVEI